MKRSILLLPVICIPGSVGMFSMACADTVVLDGDDVTDWVSAFSSYSWKHHDSCLFPNGLLKFDLSDLGYAAEIVGADLLLYVERTEPGASIEIFHVGDDSWTYGYSEPDTVWDWPVWHSIGIFAIPDTAVLSVDVTDHLTEEMADGDDEFSIKITSAGHLYPDIRISSPLAPIQRMRPRIVVEYWGPPIPPVPDLAVSTADVTFSPMRPSPGDLVEVQARVRNIGAADAFNVEVAFWDGPPGVGDLIGMSILAHLPPGGGTAPATAGWTPEEGLREIYVVVDPENTIGETDEMNNSGFRTFLVTDPDAYVTSVETFEYPGLGQWHSDSDVPKQFTYAGPKSFYIARSGAEAYHGHYSTELFLDGTADDGTVWIETAVPVDPHSAVDVTVDFELFRYAADIAFQPVVAVGLIDPELERDFDILPGLSQEGWLLHSYQKSVFTGPHDMVHIAVGLTVSWEIPGTFYIDLVRTQVTQTTSVERSPIELCDASVPTLYQNRPNPMGPLATIAYRLERDGPVTLSIYDVHGRHVRTLRDGREGAGFHEVCWDGTNDHGMEMAPGVYFYRIKTWGGEESRKLLLVR